MPIGKTIQLNMVPTMQEITKEMCQFLSIHQSQTVSDTELYNSFLMRKASEEAPGESVSVNKTEQERRWCRFEEFTRLRKLPRDVLSILGGVR